MNSQHAQRHVPDEIFTHMNMLEQQFHLQVPYVILSPVNQEKNTAQLHVMSFMSSLVMSFLKWVILVRILGSDMLGCIKNS